MNQPVSDLDSNLQIQITFSKMADSDSYLIHGTDTYNLQVYIQVQARSTCMNHQPMFSPKSAAPAVIQILWWKTCTQEKVHKMFNSINSRLAYEGWEVVFRF